MIRTLMVVLTFYCGGPCCVGLNAQHGLTKSGARPTEGWTVAADPRLFPIGTRLWIEGLGERVVQDVGFGVRGSHIDVYVDDHARALQLGRRRVRVQILDLTAKPWFVARGPLVVMPRRVAALD